LDLYWKIFVANLFFIFIALLPCPSWSLLYYWWCYWRTCWYTYWIIVDLLLCFHKLNINDIVMFVSLSVHSIQLFLIISFFNKSISKTTIYYSN